jgi:hypothetical protein
MTPSYRCRNGSAQIDAAIFALEAEIFEPLGLDPESITAEFIDAQAATR